MRRTPFERRTQSSVGRSVCGGERVRCQGAVGGEAGREASSPRSQSRRQERLDERLLPTSWAGVVAGGAYGQREDLSGSSMGSQSVTRFYAQSLGSGVSPKAFGRPIQESPPGDVTGGLLPAAFGANSVASALGSSARRDLDLRVEHITGGRGEHSKPERSTFLGSRTFYFALTRW